MSKPVVVFRSPAGEAKYKAAYEAELTEIFGELGIERAHVAGHSYGGFLATLVAIYAPDRVEKIIPLAPGGFVSLTLEGLARMLAFAFLRAPSLRESFVRWLYADGNPRNARIDEHLLLTMEHGKPALKVGGLFTDDELGRIRAPVLFLIGQDEGCFDPIAAVARAKRAVPSIEAQVIPHASHALPFEKPDIVNAAMLRFLG